MKHSPQTARSLVSSAFKTAFSNLPVFIRLAIPLVALQVLAIWFRFQGKESLYMLFMWAHIFASLFLFISVSRFADGKPLGDNPTGLTSGGVFGRYLITYAKLFLVTLLFGIISIPLFAGVGYALFSGMVQEHRNLGEPLLTLMGDTQIIAFSLISIILFLSLLMYFTARINPAMTAAALGEDSSLSSIWKLTKGRVWFIFKAYFLMTLAMVIPIFLGAVLFFKAFNGAMISSVSPAEEQHITKGVIETYQDPSLSMPEKSKKLDNLILDLSRKKVNEAQSSLAPKTLKESLILLLPSLLMAIVSVFVQFIIIIGFTRLYQTLKNTNRP